MGEINEKLRVDILSFFDSSGFDTFDKRINKEIASMGMNAQKLSKALEAGMITDNKGRQLGKINADFMAEAFAGENIAQIQKQQNAHQVYQEVMGKWASDTPKKVHAGVMEINEVLRTTGAEAARVHKTFSMEWLSIMFIGMLVGQTMRRVIGSSVQTFRELSEGSGEAGQAITALSANMTYLKFTLGQAFGEVLAPLMPTIVQFANVISDLISQNPTAFVTAIGGLAVLGTGGFIGAQVVLGLESLLNILKAYKAGEYTKLLDSLGTGIGKLAGVGIGFYYAYDSLKELNEDDMVGAISSATKSFAGFSLAAGKTKQAGALLAVGVGLELLKEVFTEGDTSLGDAVRMAVEAGLAAYLVTGKTKAGAIATIAIATVLLPPDMLRNFGENQVEQGVAKGNQAFSAIESPDTGWGIKTGAVLKATYGTGQIALGEMAKTLANVKDWFSKVGTETETYTTNTTNATAATDELDYALVGGSLVPSLDMLNESLTTTSILMEDPSFGLTPLFSFMNELVTQMDLRLLKLIETKINEIQTIQREITAVNSLTTALEKQAAAYDKLNKAKSGKSSSSNSTAAEIQRRAAGG